MQLGMRNNSRMQQIEVVNIIIIHILNSPQKPNRICKHCHSSYLRAGLGP